MIDFMKGSLTEEARLHWVAAHRECEGYTFIPNGPQFDLIRTVGMCQETDKVDFLMTSANGAGKSTGWVNILGNIFWPGLNIYTDVRDVQTNKTYQGFFDFPLYKQWPRKWPKLFWLIAKQKKMDGINKKIEQWWGPRGVRYEAYKGHYDYYSKYVVPDTGFELHCLTLDMEWLAFEGDDVGFIACDEPPKEWQHDAALFRLRMGGVLVTAATAVHESGWFEEKIINPAKEATSDKWHQTVHVDENSVDKGGQWDMGVYGVQDKGILGRKEIEMLKRTCPRDLYPARIEGKLTSLVGRVFKIYNPELHFREEIKWQHHPAHYMYRMTIDPHGRRPPFVAWLRKDRWGEVNAIDEWPSIHDPTYEYLRYHEIADVHPMTVKKICAKIIEIEEGFKIPAHRIERFMDPKFAKQPHPRKTGETLLLHWIEESEKAYEERGGYPPGHSFSIVTDINKDLEPGYEIIRDYLTMTEDTKLLLKLCPKRCNNLDYAFRNHRYKDQPQDQKEAHGLWDKLEQKHKDPIDVIRYPLLVPWTWKPPVGRTVDYQSAGDYKQIGRPALRMDSKGRHVPPKPKGVS